MRKRKIKSIPPLTQVVEGYISVLCLSAPNLRPPLADPSGVLYLKFWFWLKQKLLGEDFKAGK